MWQYFLWFLDLDWPNWSFYRISQTLIFIHFRNTHCSNAITRNYCNTETKGIYFWTEWWFKSNLQKFNCICGDYDFILNFKMKTSCQNHRYLGTTCPNFCYLSCTERERGICLIATIRKKQRCLKRMESSGQAQQHKSCIEIYQTCWIQ